MKTISTLLLLAALALGGCQSASTTSANHAATGDVAVNFQNPDKFDDVRETLGGNTSEYYLDIISKHLKEIAAARLAPGQKLTVTFTNIDLAGDFIPTGRPHSDDIRIIKDVFVPRMSLNFQLKDASGAVLKEGDRRLTDLNFQYNITPLTYRNDPLAYDKTLLDTWVASEFKG